MQLIWTFQWPRAQRLLSHFLRGLTKPLLLQSNKVLKHVHPLSWYVVPLLKPPSRLVKGVVNQQHSSCTLSLCLMRCWVWASVFPPKWFFQPLNLCGIFSNFFQSVAGNMQHRFECNGTELYTRTITSLLCNRRRYVHSIYHYTKSYLTPIFLLCTIPWRSISNIGGQGIHIPIYILFSVCVHVWVVWGSLYAAL